MEKKTEHLGLEPETRGWRSNDFAVVVMEAPTRASSSRHAEKQARPARGDAVQEARPMRGTASPAPGLDGSAWRVLYNREFVVIWPAGLQPR